MDTLKKHIYDESNGLHYTLVGDYYIPDLELPEEDRPIGRYGRLHRDWIIDKYGYFVVNFCESLFHLERYCK